MKSSSVLSFKACKRRHSDYTVDAPDSVSLQNFPILPTAAVNSSLIEKNFGLPSCSRERRGIRMSYHDGIARSPLPQLLDLARKLQVEHDSDLNMN